MVRRRAVSLLLGACAPAAADKPPATLDPLLTGVHGAALLIDIRKNQVIAAGGRPLMPKLSPPASTVEPFVLAALMARGKLRLNESLLCSGRLRIGGRTLDCSHPR